MTEAGDHIRHSSELPEGAYPTAVVELVLYLNPGGKLEGSVRRAGDVNYSELVGWMEWAKIDLIKDWVNDHPVVDK